MRCRLVALISIALAQPAAANTIQQWKSYFGKKGRTLAPSAVVKLNTRNRRNYIVATGEKKLVRQLARISRDSSREEAYIHLNDSVALETGKNESFKVFRDTCLVRATVQSSIKIDDLIAAREKPPAKIVWYHTHPSRGVIDAKFRRAGCRPPNTWPVLPSSADLSWFMERARRYYAARPDGLYRDRIVIHPLGVIELALTDQGKRVISQFRWKNNYTTQEFGNEGVPGYRILPQRLIQVLGMRIDRFKRHNEKLESEINFVVGRLSTSVMTIRFIPMRNFQ